MVTKYPVLDSEFKIKMLGSCKDDEERGMITILDLTGMHVSSLCSLKPGNLIKQGSKTYIKWVRPKTNKTLQALVPKDDVLTIENFLKMRRKTRQHYHALVKEIGERAGYEDISPMTMRHNRCIRAIDEGYNMFEVPQVMGCSPEVVFRNYAKLREDQLSKE